MKKFIIGCLVVASFTSCQKGGTYYCRDYVVSGNTLTYVGDAEKKFFVSYKAMQNYESSNHRKCEKRKK